MKTKGLLSGVLLVFLLLAGMVTYFIWPHYEETTGPQQLASHADIDGIKCQDMEGSGVHIHAHLTIINNGQPIPLPDQIGIEQHPTCYYWLHTHDRSGEIHVESPIDRTFTLGEFFDIWNKPLSSTQAASFTNGKELKIYVNDNAYTGDPRKVELTAHEQIVIEVGPTFVKPPAPFVFPPED